MKKLFLSVLILTTIIIVATCKDKKYYQESEEKPFFGPPTINADFFPGIKFVVEKIQPINENFKILKVRASEWANPYSVLAPAKKMVKVRDTVELCEIVYFLTKNDEIRTIILK